jgi:hypothetical protein
MLGNDAEQEMPPHRMGDRHVRRARLLHPLLEESSAVFDKRIEAVEMAALMSPREPPWLRQSNEVTFQPRACQCASGSRYFSMKSPRRRRRSGFPRLAPGLRHPPPIGHRP